MQLLVSRDYPVIDYQTMGGFIGRARLFRATDGAFLLHMSSEGKLETEERIIWLVRDATSWLNESPDEFFLAMRDGYSSRAETDSTQGPLIRISTIEVSWNDARSLASLY